MEERSYFNQSVFGRLFFRYDRRGLKIKFLKIKNTQKINFLNLLQVEKEIYQLKNSFYFRYLIKKHSDAFDK